MAIKSKFQQIIGNHQILSPYHIYSSDPLQSTNLYHIYYKLNNNLHQLIKEYDVYFTILILINSTIIIVIIDSQAIQETQMQKQTQQQKQRETTTLSYNQHQQFQDDQQQQQSISSNQQQQSTGRHQQQLQSSSYKQQQQQKYIMDPHQYLSFCLQDKKIKVMDQRNPILQHVYLKDVSLHKKGPLEDKIYSKNNTYYCNIRRGNTICQIYDGNQKEIMLFMCRRGMKKFYDLQPEYLKVNRKLTHQHQRYRRRIFQKVDQAINQSHKIHLYGLFKQNGQHCQISYVKQLKFWLFASKNVAILARNQQDLDNNYEKQRFYWAKLIGQQFFKTIGHLTPEQTQQFIKDIDGKTLLGQHCGYDQHQHITKYEKIQLIFYGLVENNGIDHCLPVEQCRQFLQKYQLKMSKMQKVENLTQKNKIYYSMYKMLKRIAEGTMDECGEGSVLYIISQNQQAIQKTVGMCKLKTCEYLIYRKLREMIKIYFAKKGATSNNYMKFKFEIQNLCGSYFKPPKPLQYYYQIANQAFREVKNNGKDFSDDQFRYKFVQFLENIQKKSQAKRQMQQKFPSTKQQIRRIILVCLPLISQQSSIIQKLCKKYNFQIDYSYRQSPTPNNQPLTKSMLHILHMVPRINMNQLQQNTTIFIYQGDKANVEKVINQLEGEQDLKKSHLITFIKSGDKRKSVELLRDKINGFASACLQANRNQLQNKKPINIKIAKTLKQITQNIENQATNLQNKQQQSWQQQNQKSNKNMINVILTMLIPGSGKSSLAEYIESEYSNCQQEEQYGSNIRFICSDKIRQSVMQKLKGKRKDQVDIEQLYANTKKKGLQKYLQAVKQALGEHPPQRNSILFIDRVFCPTTIAQNIQKELRRPWTKFTIVTQTQIPTKLNDYTYPHSLNYLLGCIKRCLQRQQHETLTEKPAQIIKIILKFYQMYRNFNYPRLLRQLDQQNIQAIIVPLQFIKQNEEQAENLFLKRKVQDCLKGISPGFDAPESGLYTELIQLMYKYSEHIQRKSTQEDQAEKLRMVRNNAEKLMKIVSRNK